MKLPKSLQRFLRYITVGVPTAALDLSFVFLATHYLNVPYGASVFVGYLIGISVNYVLSRRYVFKHSSRKFHHGYLYMVGAAGAGALLTTLLTALLVESLGLFYLTARLLVAGLVGVANYLFNLYVNFKVQGRH